MKSMNWTMPTHDEPPVKMPATWSQLECSCCGRPVGPEAAGSSECLLCTIMTA